MLPRCRLFVAWLLLQLLEFKVFQLPLVNAWSSKSTIPCLSSKRSQYQKDSRPNYHHISISSYRLCALTSHPRRIADITSAPPVVADNKSQNVDRLSIPKTTRSATASIVIASALLINTVVSIGATPSAVWGYGESQYLSDTVKGAIQAVRDASSTNDTPNNALVKAYENIAEIITEGKGVGGAINFQGVQLDRGFVSDEDTTIYNPGLTLLTENEKDRLVEAIVESKQQAISSNNAERWSTDLESGYSFLRERLDPLHMYELRGYLSIVPWYGAFMYLVALAIQQVARDAFPIAYIVCAAAVFLPIAVLVALGP